MLFNSVLFSALLLATTVQAVPHPSRVRSDCSPSGKKPYYPPSCPGYNTISGAIIPLDKSQQDTFTYVAGNMKVPDVTGQGGDGAIFAVGLDVRATGDPDACPNGFFEIGFGVTIENGAPSYAALFKDPFSGVVVDYSLNISPGDFIFMSASMNANDYTSGTGVVENLNTSAVWSVEFRSSPSRPICGLSAAWVVEETSPGNPLVNFYEVQFLGSVADITNRGVIYPDNSATTWPGIFGDPNGRGVQPVIAGDSVSIGYV